MDEFLVQSANGVAQLVFYDRTPADRDQPIEGYWVRLVDLNLTAAGSVYAGYANSHPASLFAEMSRQWSGWTGELEWQSLEYELALRCTNDRRGHIRIAVQLGSAHAALGTLTGKCVWRSWLRVVSCNAWHRRRQRSSVALGRTVRPMARADPSVVERSPDRSTSADRRSPGTPNKRRPSVHPDGMVRRPCHDTALPILQTAPHHFFLSLTEGFLFCDASRRPSVGQCGSVRRPATTSWFSTCAVDWAASARMAAGKRG